MMTQEQFEELFGEPAEPEADAKVEADMVAGVVRTQYKSFVDVGFTPKQALELVKTYITAGILASKSGRDLPPAVF